MEALVLTLVLRPGRLADSDAGTVPDGEVDAVLAVEDGDSELPSLLLALVSTAELAVLLTDPEASGDIPLDVGLELAREDGPLGNEDSVYGPPVDDTLETVGNELIVQVSTSVVVRSVIWEVDAFVAIVVTRLVVIVMGRLEDQLIVSELSTDSVELGLEGEGIPELVRDDDGDPELSSVEGADPDDDVWAVEALGELEGLGLDVSAEDGIVDSAVPEDDTAEEEASLELWQEVSAGCRGRGKAFGPT